MQAAALATLAKLGTTCTVKSVTSVYDFNNGGTTTETVTDYTATCSDLIDEAKRYDSLQTDERVSGTFYLAASGLDMTPKPSDRVVYDGRTFHVVAVWPYRVQGGLVAWRLDVFEVGDA